LDIFLYRCVGQDPHVCWLIPSFPSAKAVDVMAAMRTPAFSRLRGDSLGEDGEGGSAIDLP